MAEDSEKIFETNEQDDSNERNRKESLQRWYSTQRFDIEKKYFTNDENVLVDAGSMENYVK